MKERSFQPGRTATTPQGSVRPEATWPHEYETQANVQKKDKKGAGG